MNLIILFLIIYDYLVFYDLGPDILKESHSQSFWTYQIAIYPYSLLSTSGAS